MSKDYDVIVIGTGPGGGTGAGQCASAGLKTAIIDQRPYGGTCPLRGCNPKKLLYNAAEAVARVQDLREMGLKGVPRIAWPELIRFKRSQITGPVPEKVEESYKKNGIDVHHGHAVFSGPDSLEVAGRTLTAEKILIGAGARPRPLDFPGKEHLITSDQFLELDELPESLIFLGGGYIAFELAHISARHGRKITIVEMGDRPLTRFDPDLVDLLVKSGEEIGISLHTGLTAQAIEMGNGEYVVRATGNGAQREFKARGVVHGAGRVPDIESLNLEAADVAYGKKGIAVNEYLQSRTNARIFAAGDAADTPYMLTPAASRQGEVAADNIITPQARRYDPTGTPSIMFSIPPLASVGLLESQAGEKGLEFETRFENTSSWFMSRSTGLRHSALKILIEKKSRKILGAHMLGRHADEVINLLALAVRFDLTADDLLDAVYTYPSATRELKDVMR